MVGTSSLVMTCVRHKKLTHAIPVTRYSKKKNKKVPSTSGDNVRGRLWAARPPLVAFGWCVEAFVALAIDAVRYWYRGSRALESKFG